VRAPRRTKTHCQFQTQLLVISYNLKLLRARATVREPRELALSAGRKSLAFNNQRTA